MDQWNTASGQNVAILDGHKRADVGVQFCLDGRSLISFTDGELFRWESPR